MKKIALIALATLVLSGLSACEAPRQHKQVNKYVKTVKLTHMSDGSWARYDDSNDVWLWYYMSTNYTGVGPNPAGLSVGSAYTGSSFSGGGYWKSGSIPTTTQRTGSTETEEEVQTDAEGNPVSEEELQAFQEEEQAAEAEGDNGQTETGNDTGNDGNADGGTGGDTGGDTGGGDAGGGDGGGGE